MRRESGGSNLSLESHGVGGEVVDVIRFRRNPKDSGLGHANLIWWWQPDHSYAPSALMERARGVGKKCHGCEAGVDKRTISENSSNRGFSNVSWRLQAQMLEE